MPTIVSTSTKPELVKCKSGTINNFGFSFVGHESALRGSHGLPEGVYCLTHTPDVVHWPNMRLNEMKAKREHTKAPTTHWSYEWGVQSDPIGSEKSFVHNPFAKNTIIINKTRK